MSRSFAHAQFRQYISSMDVVQEEEWAEMERALEEIGRPLGPKEMIDVSWVAALIMATRR
ncbi:hypothetical protein DL93DRAFT_2077694 [Clavulina sp. PMI_390]|nr:hypothetical protein DL93DRAFT_2077694 [Clavulina sp. PMI_390]